MKRNVLYVITIILVIATCICFAIYYSFLKKDRIQNMLKDSNAQVELLYNIYQDALNSYDYSDYTINPDSSALKNVITTQDFSDEQKAKLNELFDNINSKPKPQVENDIYTYTFSVSYDSKKHKLVITNKNNRSGNTLSYTIDIKDNSLVFEKDPIEEPKTEEEV